MVVLFVPETRFKREANRSVTPRQDNKRAGEANFKIQDVKGDPIQASGKASDTRKTVLQELSPWSGIDRHTSYLNLFLRPFPLVLYPACAFAALSCKSSGKPSTMHL